MKSLRVSLDPEIHEELTALARQSSGTPAEIASAIIAQALRMHMAAEEARQEWMEAERVALLQMYHPLGPPS